MKRSSSICINLHKRFLFFIMSRSDRALPSKNLQASNSRWLSSSLVTACSPVRRLRKLSFLKNDSSSSMGFRPRLSLSASDSTRPSTISQLKCSNVSDGVETIVAGAPNAFVTLQLLAAADADKLDYARYTPPLRLTLSTQQVQPEAQAGQSDETTEAERIDCILEPRVLHGPRNR